MSPSEKGKDSITISMSSSQKESIEEYHRRNRAQYAGGMSGFIRTAVSEYILQKTHQPIQKPGIEYSSLIYNTKLESFNAELCSSIFIKWSKKEYIDLSILFSDDLIIAELEEGINRTNELESYNCIYDIVCLYVSVQYQKISSSLFYYNDLRTATSIIYSFFVKHMYIASILLGKKTDSSIGRAFMLLESIKTGRKERINTVIKKYEYIQARSLVFAFKNPSSIYSLYRFYKNGGLPSIDNFVEKFENVGESFFQFDSSVFENISKGPLEVDIIRKFYKKA